MRILFRDGISFGQRCERLGIRVHQAQELFPQNGRLVQNGLYIILYSGIFLFAYGEISNHRAQGRAQGTRQSSGSAAAGDRLLGSQDLCKICTGVVYKLIAHIMAPFPHRVIEGTPVGSLPLHRRPNHRRVFLE